jgi:hypothetical protein
MFSRLGFNRSLHLNSRLSFRNPKRGGFRIEDELSEFLDSSKNDTSKNDAKSKKIVLWKLNLIKLFMDSL